MTVERENNIYTNRQGSEFIIIKYTNTRNIRIKFLDKFGYEKNVKWDHIKKGSIKNPYFPYVFNIGYMGNGRHKSKINGKTNLFYSKWINMLNRCHGDKIKNNTSYTDCTVCEEWYNYQNFAKWCEENYYNIDGEQLELDKDILYKGNKIYSPETCVFVPHNINSILVKCNTKRGKYPIGVHYDSKINKLKVQYMNQITNKRVCIGTFEINEEKKAFNCYKTYKEAHIKEVANKYKNKIPNNLYQALLNYEVEIID
ncbi:hypothetical protein [Paenibacillus oleatilyticus]|uniref:hypothetical protein n=1 Tax=Paenibacillus oleatilyticus TaxID=2594886 RepID=UPI001C1FD37D|nr:hypothetical protein [Paenibacillus oleatilyticus]MBU7315987.1 hypothetical protein [Paenibacillus oleatilyticus]